MRVLSISVAIFLVGAAIWFGILETYARSLSSDPDIKCSYLANGIDPCRFDGTPDNRWDP